MSKFRWCFIGTGKLAHTVAKQILDSGRHEIVSCYTRNYDNAVSFVNEFGGVAYRTIAEAVTAEGVDAVYVVTPHNVHYQNVKEVLELGKPVLCEKAFTVEASETDELIALAREKDLYLCEAMWTWFSPAANKAKEWVNNGKIGNITDARFTYHMNSVNYAPRVADPKRAGGALLDITVYPITYAYRLWGYPDHITSVGNLSGGIDLGEDIIFEYDNGLKVSISASIADMKGFEKMQINGTDGCIKAILYHAMNSITCKKGLFNKEVFKGDGPRMNSYLDEFDTVASEIREGLKESRMVPLQATSDVMHIMDTIRGQIGLYYKDLEK
ncbi:MAG: Gfo/Idh/MocA family oxidoreductase [Lachnospiraceae bacterium]|nr:Gfo/Idh/MocA family oxidoreductase [Lachnospiraceae bacterium]